MEDEKYIYVFIRQDLTVPQQLVHVSHAVYHMARSYPGYVCPWSTPAVVVIGVPDLRSLNRVAEKMLKSDIYCYVWVDPDVELGMLSIATAPLGEEQRAIMKNYRLYSEPNNIYPRDFKGYETPA